MAQEYENIDNLLDKRQEEADEAKMKARKEKVDALAVDYSKAVAKPVVILRDPDDPEKEWLTEGQIFAIIGPAKTYKSCFTSLLVITYFQQNPDGECIWIDTEQGEYHIIKIAQRICRGMEWGFEWAMETGKLQTFRLRQFSPKERVNNADAIVKVYPKPLVVVDGCRDLVYDINKSDEAADALAVLMKWNVEQKISIITVIHTNRDGETARGHLGAELENKAETRCWLSLDVNDENRVIIKFGNGRNFRGYTKYMRVDKYMNPTWDEQITDVLPLIEFTSDKKTNAWQSLKVTTKPREAWLRDITIGGNVRRDTAEKYFADFVERGLLLEVGDTIHSFEHYGVNFTDPQPPGPPAPDTQQQIPTEDDAPF